MHYHNCQNLRLLLKETTDFSKHGLLQVNYTSMITIFSSVLVDARKNSEKISAHGLFPGAQVTRGVDWEWGIQNGRHFVIISL